MDGTTNLIHRFQHSAVSLALAEDGQVTFGVVYHPYTQECLPAQRGGGAFQNGRPIRVSKTGSLSAVCCPQAQFRAGGIWLSEPSAKCERCYDRCQDVRRTGCASLDLCYVACGRLDGYVELASSPGIMPPECFW